MFLGEREPGEICRVRCETYGLELVRLSFSACYEFALMQATTTMSVGLTVEDRSRSVNGRVLVNCLEDYGSESTSSSMVFKLCFDIKYVLYNTFLSLAIVFKHRHSSE